MYFLIEEARNRRILSGSNVPKLMLLASLGNVIGFMYES